MNKTSLPRHCELNYFPADGNHLLAGGQRLEELVDRVGTPAYVYDRELISQRIKLLRDTFPEQVRLHYAVKANPMPALVQHLATLVDGFDVASQHEMRVALATNMATDNICFTGPGKGNDELLTAIEAGVIINLESEVEMLRVVKLAEIAGNRPRVMVRVNPDFELKSSGLRMGGGAKQFGTDAEQVPELLKKLGTLDLAFEGLHVFSGSQNLQAEAIIEAQNASLQLAIELAEFAPSEIRLLNLGGGFGIPYFPGDQPLALSPIGDNFIRLCEQVNSALPNTALALELGRFLVGEAGIYVCHVLEKKVSRGQTFLITDGGMHQHLAASGNLGQVVRKNYPVVIGNKMAEAQKEVVTIVGRLCTPLDLLADKMELPKAEADDLVVILQSGAYGYSASPLHFLGHPLPSEILV
jgi:diaminopimelate decarboxylase